MTVFERLFDLASAPSSMPSSSSSVQTPLSVEVPAEPRHRIGRHRRRELLLGDVGHAVAEVVTAEAERHALDERGPVAVARPADRLGECCNHRERVVAVDRTPGMP